ncbi:MAG: VPLPA-CTERM sorting domain-containing protein [Pseudomonadota bacterium]
MFTRALALAAGLFMSTQASATTLTTFLNVDNDFEVYLSTSDTVQGTSFGTDSDGNWGTGQTNTTTLADGTDYFLHIRAIDFDTLAMLIGTFTLSDTDFSFANGGQTLASGDAALLGSTTGWGSYSPTTDLGANGSGPWGFRSGHDGAARYVWAGSNTAGGERYFTAAISYDAAPVPLPAGGVLLGGALATLAFARRKRAKR